MATERVRVWVQKFNDRRFPMLQWVDPETGRRRSKSAGTDDAKAIERARADLEYELNNDLHRDKSRMTWDRFVEIYAEEKLAEHGKSNRQRAMTTFASYDAAMRPRTLGAINERTISAYVGKLRERGSAPATIHCHLRYLKTALRWAATQKLIGAAPKFVMPKVPKGTTRAKVRAAARLTGEEFDRLLMKSPNDGWRLLIGLAWHAGLRLQEARNVEGGNVDLERHLIRLPSNKAGDLDAVAFITPELDAMLREQFPDGLPEGRLVRGVPGDVYGVSKGFIKIAKAAAIKGGSKGGSLTFHDLRRAYGSRWAGKVPAQVLQRMMRHASITTTMTYYADTEQAALAAVWPGDPTPKPTPRPTPKRQRNRLRNTPHSGDAADSP